MPSLDLAAYGRFDDAIARGHYNEAFGIATDLMAAQEGNAKVVGMLAEAHMRRGEYSEAIVGFNEAIALDGAGEPAWWCGLAQSYLHVNDHHGCLVAGKIADEMGHRAADLQVDMSVAARLCDPDHGYERAEEHILRALAYDSSHPRARMAHGEHLLAKGEFQAGWREYAWRKQVDPIDPKPMSSEWAGQRLPTGTLIIITHGGYGDAIQFSRLIPMAQERVGKVVLASAPEMASLWTFPGVDVVTTYKDFPPHAAHIGIMDLPGIFGLRMEPTKLHIPDDLIQERHEKFFAFEDRRPKVGLCWRGRPTHKDDYRRSIPLERLDPLIAEFGAAFYSLQMDAPPAECGFIINPLEDVRDWRDTAAHIMNLDLVISVDTAVAHLAATLGKETWTLLPEPAEWRWMRGRAVTPWYETMKLMRQITPGSWSEIIDAVAVNLSLAVRFYRKGWP